MLPSKQTIFRRTKNVYRGSRRHVTKYVARAVYAGRQYSQYRRGDSTSGTAPGSEGNVPLHQKLADAWKNTPTKWYPLPVLVGALLLVALNYRKRHKQSSSTDTDTPNLVDRDGNDAVRLRGPLSVHVIGALPLRNMSRLWGYLNSLELPVWARPTGFRVYSYIFGCNLDEIEHSDLTKYKSLGDFFYRRLKEGARPIASAPLVSPADGTILHFGTVKGLRVEQVKGLTYSLDALLGKSEPPTPTSQKIHFPNVDHQVVVDQEFADINGIEYSLDQLLGTSEAPTVTQKEADKEEQNASEFIAPNEDVNQLRKLGEAKDASLPASDQTVDLAHDTSVAMDIGARPPLTRAYSDHQINPHNQLYFCVIYLAPGDYHRFHSPAAWVVEKRRHFFGELFSVSPYMARRLQNLFVLNERVALLGRWKFGFFGMVPVGATNVGSILLNFDRDLRTNLRGRRQPPGTFTEAVYSKASPILNGKPLKPGEEMGGFCLGSTIVLVFEAPKTFEFDVQDGQKVKVGQRLGDVRTSDNEKEQ